MLFCVGAQKAGTTWLADNLARHPECHFFPFEKEMHYFDTAYGSASGMKWYRLRQVRRAFDALETAEGERYTRLIRRAQGNLDLMKIFRDGPLGAQAWMYHLAREAGPRTKWLCDFTPDYAHCPAEAYQEMAEYSGGDGFGPKFIFIMRDPVDRHWSFLRMLLKHRDVAPEDAERTLRGWLEHDIRTGPIARALYSDYRATVEKLDAHAPADSILLLFYEDLFSQPTYDRVCDFLEIPRAPGNFEQVHEGEVKIPIPDDLYPQFCESLLDIYTFANDRFGDDVPQRWLRHWNS